MAPDRKTKPEPGDAHAYLATIADARRRADAEVVLALMEEVTGSEPVMWGPSMVGFGVRPYATADGKQREWFAVGLSPRKAALTLYGLLDPGRDEELLDRLGPHTTGKGCVYVKHVADIDRDVLAALVRRAWESVEG